MVGDALVPLAMPPTGQYFCTLDKRYIKILIRCLLLDNGLCPLNPKSVESGSVLLRIKYMYVVIVPLEFS